MQEDLGEERGGKGEVVSSHAQPRKGPNVGKEEAGKKFSYQEWASEDVEEEGGKSTQGEYILYFSSVKEENGLKGGQISQMQA